MLKLYVLGDFRIIANKGQRIDLPTKRARSLFAYLCLHRHQVHYRERLAESVWGESYGDNKKALRNELWAIRKAIRAVNIDPRDILETVDGTVRITDKASIWMDATELTGQMARDPEYRDISPLLSLYKGEFAPGLYDDWTHGPREEIRQRYLLALERNMLRHQQDENWDDAILAAGKLVEADPVLEFGHRSLMLYHFEKGNRAAAIRQYNRCRAILRTEFGIEPMSETTQLYRGILEDAGSLTKLEQVNETPQSAVSLKVARRQPANTQNDPEHLSQA